MTAPTPQAPTVTPSDSDLARAQRRTLRTLIAGQAVGAMGITIGIATASLLALELSGSERYAGLAQTAQVLGTAGFAYLLARLMGNHGRRRGLVTGYLCGAAGALLAVLAGVLGSLVLLLIGAILLGATTAANNGARYAATDLAQEHQRGRALSLVVWATTIGAVLGPNLTGPAGAVSSRLNIPALTGPFLVGAVAMAAAAVILTVFLRPDPLLLALAASGGVAPAATGTSWGRAVAVLRERPVVAAAIAGMSLAHAAMVSVMVMTPLHMEHGGANLEVIGFVISVHVLGMFAFSPVVGWACDRIGRGRVLIVGGVLLLLALLTAGSSPEGSSPLIFAGLFLLGLGWSCATVAGSTLVADHSPLATRTDVQGTSDVVMSLTAALAGGLSGVVMAAGGYALLNLLAGVLGAGVVAAGVLALRSDVSVS